MAGDSCLELYDKAGGKLNFLSHCFNSILKSPIRGFPPGVKLLKWRFNNTELKVGVLRPNEIYVIVNNVKLKFVIPEECLSCLPDDDVELFILSILYLPEIREAIGYPENVFDVKMYEKLNDIASIVTNELLGE